MNSWKTIPNAVTVLGVFLTLGYAWAFLSHKNDWILPLLISAYFTDFLDGFLARALNQRSRVGYFLDPIRDKILLVAVFINLFLIFKENAALNDIIIATLAGIATFEISNAIIIWEGRFPRPIHWMGKVRGFVHFVCSSAIVASNYIGWPVPTAKSASWLLFPMLVAAFLARAAYMFQPSPAETKLEELTTQLEQLNQAPKPKS